MIMTLTHFLKLNKEKEGVDNGTLDSLKFREDFRRVAESMLASASESLPNGSLDEKLKYSFPTNEIKQIDIQSDSGREYVHFFKYHTVYGGNTALLRPLTSRPSPDLIRERLEYISLGLDLLKR